MPHDATPDAPDTGPSIVTTRTMDLVVAFALLLVGLAVVTDSVRLGYGWDPTSGPQAGYFPFYIGLTLIASCLVTLGVTIAVRPSGGNSFIRKAQLGKVLQVLVPAILFVALIGLIGIYLSAALYIGFFMWWIGKYPLYKLLPVSLIVPFVVFLMFEIWFLVPLPKGPVETWFGY